MFCIFFMILFLLHLNYCCYEHCNTRSFQEEKGVQGEESSRPHICTNSCSCLTFNFNGDTPQNKYNLLILELSPSLDIKFFHQYASEFLKLNLVNFQRNRLKHIDYKMHIYVDTKKSPPNLLGFCKVSSKIY